MIELKHVSYAYSGTEKNAVNDISCVVNNGEIVLCTGRSGCGKSTLIRLINGLCLHYYQGKLQGDVVIDGENLKDLELGQIAKKVGTLFQDPERQFFALNVEDEIAFALEWQGITREEIKKRVEDVIARFNLEEIRLNPISALSEGQKQKVGLAEIIALCGKNIILDEPTANLDPKSTIELRDLLLELKQEGYCIFIVDHRHYWLKDAVDKVLVMDDGKLYLNGDFEILGDPQVQERYGLRKAFVEDKREKLEDIDPKCEDYVVRGTNLCFTYKNGKEIFKDFNFALPPGISVLLGENGSGKTTLSRLIFSLEKKSSGTIEFKGFNDVNPLRLGSIVLQNTDYQLNMQTVYDEIAVCMQLTHHEKPSREQVLDLLRKLDLQDLEKRHPQSLSGGQKQRLVIACALAKDPQLLILDEPTSGLDGANMHRIKKILSDFVKNGRSALVITHDLELMDDINLKALRLIKRKE